MVVRLVKDWNFPDIMRQSPGVSGEWNGIRFTEDKLTECDILVVFNRPQHNLFCKVREGGAWLFSQESPIGIYDWHKKSFPYFDKVYTFWENDNAKNIFHDQTMLPWHIGKSYDELKALEPGHLKTDEVSWVTSSASSKEGHRLRMAFLEFLNSKQFPLRLFGRGFNPIDDKFDGIYPYKYSIAVENYSCNDYWTEKIADCLLSWTLPFYYGAKNIQKFLPEGSMVHIDPAKPEESLDIINAAISEDLWAKRLDAIREARELILEKYQFFPAIARKIEEMKLKPGRKLKLIPGNSNGILNEIPLTTKLKVAWHNFKVR